MALCIRADVGMYRVDGKQFFGKLLIGVCVYFHIINYDVITLSTQSDGNRSLLIAVKRSSNFSISTIIIVIVSTIGKLINGRGVENISKHRFFLQRKKKHFTLYYTAFCVLQCNVMCVRIILQFTIFFFLTVKCNFILILDIESFFVKIQKFPFYFRVKILSLPKFLTVPPSQELQFSLLSYAKNRDTLFLSYF